MTLRYSLYTSRGRAIKLSNFRTTLRLISVTAAALLTLPHLLHLTHIITA